MRKPFYMTYSEAKDVGGFKSEGGHHIMARDVDGRGAHGIIFLPSPKYDLARAEQMLNQLNEHFKIHCQREVGRVLMSILDEDCDGDIGR